MIDPVNVGHSDLYVIVQLFCLIMRASKFSFIGKAWFRQATLSYGSSYYSIDCCLRSLSLFKSVSSLGVLASEEWRKTPAVNVIDVI